MRLKIDDIVYFYIFICVSLLLFNLFYIVCARGIVRRREDKARRWEDVLDDFISNGADAPRRWEKLFRRLHSVEELIAFQKALRSSAAAHPYETHRFFLKHYKAFCDLALVYGKKEPMERAFFAYVIAAYFPPVKSESDRLLEILLGYLENSTVYCRENVLNALYALGSAHTVLRAFDLLNERGWYHYPRLLSDGLVHFSGDREALARRLWDRRKEWAEFLVVGTVQFAANLPGDVFSQSFLEALAGETLSLEIRFALIRYFQRHPFEAAKPVLLELLEHQTGDENRLAIAVASALSAYPGGDTRQALLRTLHSRTWHIRHNAALSLRALGVTRQEIAQIGASDDRYAIEMLEYVLGLEIGAPPTPSQEKVVSCV